MFQFHSNIFDNVVVVQHLNVHFLDLLQVNHQYPKDFFIKSIKRRKKDLLFVYVNNLPNVVVKLN
jgi:hypothetical protein